MFRNYVLIAWRNFVKHRTFSIINITGFALAMASCFLIVFHIRSELSYEKFYPGYQNIYRLHVPEWAKSSPPMRQAVLDFFPEVTSATRFYEFSSGDLLQYESYQTIVGLSYMADSSALDMFNYEFVEGSAKTSLRTPKTSIMTESLARRIFGNSEAVGKTVKLGDIELTISGVVKDVPEHTHLQFDLLTSYTTFYKLIPDNWANERGWMAPYTYLYIEPGQFKNVMSKMPDFQVKFYEGWEPAESLRSKKMLDLMPLADIHLQSNLEQEMGPNSNLGYLYIFAAVALFILFIASVNFINLNISLAFRRMKETGLRKVMGAVRGQLVKQYLAETTVTSVVALIAAMGLFFAVIPSYNSLAGRDVSMTDIFTPDNIAILAALIVGVSLLSGAYPAFFMSKFKPTDALKSQKGPGGSTPVVRKALVVFQFAVSAFMIASTIIIIRQMNFFKNQDLGFNKNQVVAVSLSGELGKKVWENPNGVRNELKKYPEVLRVGLTSDLPGNQMSVEGVVPEGADPNAEFPSFRVTRVDDQTLDVLEIAVIEGRGFSLEYNDSASFILNKAAVKALNLTDPVGSRIVNQTRNQAGTVVGVVDDYHFASLHNAVEPLLIEYKPNWTNNLLIKVNTTEMPETISRIEKTLKSIAPSLMFSYSFYDDRWDSQYKEENKMNVLFSTFSVFMIVISCIGLFGLSAITLQTRRKEIGIRKVVGASMQSLIGVLSKEFMILVLIGAVVGLPLSWYAMNTWLARFAYKISITADIFVIAVVLSLAIALASVLFNALKAARTNPVDSLRSE